jgi:hypothetical protein
LKLLARAFLITIGFAFGVFCLFLASVGAIRLHGWSETGRLAPPHYPGIEKFDVISFSADPLRAALEIGGNGLLVVVAVSGLVALVFIFRRGLEWMSSWPVVLPLTLYALFLATAAATIVGRTARVLPASLVLGSAAACVGWMCLRQRGLSISARVSELGAVLEQNAPAHVRERGRVLQITGGALLVLLAIMKLMAAFRS